jgi:branched-chain amino acid transport system substrate-binding protein
MKLGGAEMKKRVVILLTFILVGLIAFIQTALAAETWRIGAIISTTGHYAPLGTAERQAMISLSAKINGQGGILGRKLEVLYEDDEGIPAKSAFLAKKLIYQEKVIGILGPSVTACAMAAAAVCEEAGISMIFMTPTKEVVGGKKYIFHVTPGSDLDAIFISRFIENKLKAKTVAILHGPSQYDMSVARLVTQEVKKNPKLELIASEKWSQDDKDMTPYLLNIRAKKPQALVIGGSAFGPAVAIRNIRDLKMDIPIICTSGTAQQEFLDLAGEAANGVYVTSRLQYGNPLPEEKDIFETIQREYKVLPSSFHANGWDALLVMAEVIKRGNGDPKSIRNALENLKNFKGAIGTYNISPTDHNGLTTECVVMLQIKNRMWAVAD